MGTLGRFTKHQTTTPTNTRNITLASIRHGLAHDIRRGAGTIKDGR